jgi:putative ABC transport system permease protein
MLSRGQTRAREIAVRLAIGASRLRLVRQLMMESLVIAVLGGLAGLFVAEAAAGYFTKVQTAAVAASDAPVVLRFQVDRRVLSFTLIVSVASAVLFGLIPAIRSTKPDLTPALKGSVREHPRKQLWGRHALVAGQLAGSVVLLISGAGVYRASTPLLENRGFRTDGVLAVRFDTGVSGYDANRSALFQNNLLKRVRALPGVESVAFTFSVPLTSTVQQKTVVPEGYAFPAGEESATVLSTVISEDYFRVLAISMFRGRPFLESDTAASPRVAIVNAAFADQYFNGDAVGKRIRAGGENDSWVEIVGVAATGKYLSLVEPPTSYLYLPIRQNGESRLTMLVRTSGNPVSLAGPVRDLLRGMDPDVPVISVRTLENIFERAVVQPLNMVVTILGSASIIGFVLALAGLYGVVSYQTGRRTREIGIRMALGAERPQVLAMILKQSSVVAVAGIAVGVVLSLALRGVLDAGSEPSPVDPLLYAGVPVALFLTTVLAALVPARGAVRVDPLVALREE